ncbi:MAG: hypothetical protein JWR07_4063 [Nevskia sp.]|nr:hypothetical protein [Nevskia sp.]
MTVQDERVRELIAEQAAEWYVENRGGEMTAQQKQEFMRWLRASPLNVSEYLAIAGIARGVGNVAKGVQMPLEELIAQASADSNVVQLPTANRPRAEQALSMKPERRLNRPFAGRGTWASAAVAVAIVIGGWAWLSQQSNNQQYATRHGEERTLTLADDTVVHLNSDSALAVHFDEHHRDVEVERGQALFEVAKDATRPFQVRAGTSVIEDIGTVFDVFRQDAQTVVTVVEGQVTVWDSASLLLPAPATSPSSALLTKPQPLADLRAGDQVRIAQTGQVETRRAANVQKATAWVRNEIVFDRDSIASVAAEFNRYNRIQIKVDDPRVAAMPISGVFHTYDIESFADFLNGLHGVHAAMLNQQLLVSSRAAASSAD